MKIVITGGAGFIGSQLGKSLHEDGHEVILVDDMSYGYLDNLVIDGRTFGTFCPGDVRSKDDIMALFDGADVVFHFAGISSLPACQENPGRAIDVNVAGTANVLECARLAAVDRVVFASTGAVYENSTSFPSSEHEASLEPTLIYPISKLQAEQVCRSYVETYGMPIVVLRFFNVYGPHQDFKRLSPPLMSYIIRELLHDRAPVLHSNGTQERDCIYVDDVLRMCKVCMTHDNAVGEIINVGSGVSTSVLEIYNIIRTALGSRLEAQFTESQNYWNAYPTLHAGRYPIHPATIAREVRKYTLASTTKARALLHWEPQISIRTGLANTALYAKRVHWFGFG